MIYDLLQNAPLYADLHPRINIAFDFLTFTDLTKLTPGRIDLEGNSVYVLVQEYMTKPVEEGKWEAHKRYIDVQYMLSGCERVDFALINTMQLGDFFSEKDFQAMTGTGHSLNLFTGSFVIFHPQDAHMPGLSIGLSTLAKKIVVKCEI